MKKNNIFQRFKNFSNFERSSESAYDSSSSSEPMGRAFLPDRGTNFICNCNLSSFWSEPIVKTFRPEIIEPESLLEDKHQCEYCRETNYSSPYYDTDFT